MKLTGGHRVGLKHGAAHGGEVLDGMPVTGTQGDELGIEYRAACCLRERLQQRTETLPETGSAARPRACAPVLIDGDEKAKTVPFRLKHPSLSRGPSTAGAGEHRNRRHTTRLDRNSAAYMCCVRLCAVGRPRVCVSLLSGKSLFELQHIIDTGCGGSRVSRAADASGRHPPAHSRHSQATRGRKPPPHKGIASARRCI